MSPSAVARLSVRCLAAGVTVVVLGGFLTLVAIRWVSPEPLTVVVYEEHLDEHGDPLGYSLTKLDGGCSVEPMSLTALETEDAVSLTFHDRRHVWSPPLYRPLMALMGMPVHECLMLVGARAQLDQPLGERQVIDASTSQVVEVVRDEPAALPADTAFQRRVGPKLEDLRRALGPRLVDYQLDPAVLYVVVDGERSVAEDVLVEVLGDDADAVRLRADDG